MKEKPPLKHLPHGNYERADWFEARCQALESALRALGVCGNGYCFCSQNRDPDKIDHEPECNYARALL
jgi:hypothetical protein